MTMLDGSGEIAPGIDPASARDAPGGRVRVMKSATRALEVIELFAVCRHFLSVKDVAEMLEIPQSSSSVLLKALCQAGFIVRDRETRRYMPSVRSAFLGGWTNDLFIREGSLSRSLDALAAAACADVRLGVRNGVHVQYAYASSCDEDRTDSAPFPGMELPICHDALGQILLAGEDRQRLRDIVRHANAVTGERWLVNVNRFCTKLEVIRQAGFAECGDLVRAGQGVLAIKLPPRFGVHAAIGLGLPAARADRAALLRMLHDFVEQTWRGDA